MPLNKLMVKERKKEVEEKDKREKKRF